MTVPDRRACSQGAPPGDLRDNTSVAQALRDYADLLEAQGDDGFRIRAYRKAADRIDLLRTPLGDILAKEGRQGLIALPAIGAGIATAIAEMLQTGRWSQLDRLRGELAPERLFQTLPGIGPILAERLAEEAHLESLEQLETALHDPGADLPGIGPRRRAALKAVLAQRLGRRLNKKVEQSSKPPVSLLLDADTLYRQKAAAGELRLIAPRRFNSDGRAWLPVLHAARAGWHLTLLFSNTAQAHRLGRTGDWVVVYFETDDGAEGRATIVTETRGPLEGRRVVRGREGACAAYYGVQT